MALSSERVLPAAWAEVLERIERSLEQLVRLVDERERALAPSQENPQLNAAWHALLERLTCLEKAAPQAERGAAEADAALADAVEAASEWLRAAEALRGKLADWAGRAV